MKSIIKQKHTEFVDGLKKTIDKPDRRLNFKVEETCDDSHLTEEELQAQIASKFEELFGPLVDDEEESDDCTWE